MTNPSAQPDGKQAAARVRGGAQASWAGSLRDGSGSLSLDSSAVGPLPISRNCHHGDDLAVNVSAQCTLHIEGTDWKAGSMDLEVDVPGLDPGQLAAAVSTADWQCRLSKVMRGNTEIWIRATGTPHAG